jgi:hypothetical protein
MRHDKTGIMLTTVAVAALSIGIGGQGRDRQPPPNFVPDWTFAGTALTGMQQVGQATWRVENGEIVGTPTSPDGGWLLLDKGYQDVQVSAAYRCAAGCTAGVMVRSEKGNDGTKGIYTVISSDERSSAAITVDAQGKIASREPLSRSGGAMTRFAPPKPAPGAARPAGGGGGGGAGGPGGAGAGQSGFTSMFKRPDTTYKSNDWNRVDVQIEVDVFRANVNGRGSAVAIDGETGTYGPVALHVAGSGEVRFKDIAIRDLARRVTPAEQVGSRFRAQHFEDFYYGWSAAAGDFNHDGVLDVTMGNRFYLGPDFTDSREVFAGQAFNPAKEYTPAMVNFAFDYTADGWDDILVVESRTPVLYVNPKGESRRWTRYVVFTTPVISESISFKDVNGDGKPDAVYSGGGTVQWVGVDTANPTGPWKTTVVSQAGVPPPSIHGIGSGDISGDGKVDIIAPHGWWEQPAGGASQSPWKFHQAAFGRNGNAGGNMEVYDVNGDKLPDVVTALAAHGFGLAWYEQKRDAAGAISFVEHVIMDNFASKNAGGVTFTELHALTIADVDGDGIQDIVTGKRHWAHLDSYTDPDPHGAPVLYWFRTVRNPKAQGGAEFVPELIHNRSGVGSMIQVADMNKDGAIDIIAATNRGGHIFWNKPRAKK